MKLLKTLTKIFGIISLLLFSFAAIMFFGVLMLYGNVLVCDWPRIDYAIQFSLGLSGIFFVLAAVCLVIYFIID